MRTQEQLFARKEYVRVILFAKSQNRPKKDGNYYERHHILPKSLFPNWKTKKSNLVLLTAREHFIVHQLLIKIYPDSNEMKCAFVPFQRPNADYEITTEEYEQIKRYNAELMKNRMTGKKKSPESVIKSANTRRGTKRTEAAKKLMSEKQKEFHLKNPDKNNLPTMEWFTNGKENLHLLKGSEPPKGFYKGRTVFWKINTEHNKLYIGSKWYTNGIKNIRVKNNEIPPEGFYKGQVRH